MKINVAGVSIVKSAECISCSQCVIACPSQTNDLQMTIFGKAIKPFAFIIAVIALFFGSLFILDRTGFLRVTIPPVTSVIENSNYIKFVDLRGSMSIEMGAKYVGMELAEFYRIMEIPKTVPKETWMKDISIYVPGYDFHVIKGSR
jgi:ferredoxin